MSFKIEQTSEGVLIIPVDFGSPEIIAKAKAKFAKALLAMEAVRKDGRNPAFKSKYATLPNVLATVGEALDPQGLALTCTEIGLGAFVKQAFVITDSETGASFVAGFSTAYKPEKTGAQGTGSAEGYAIRRGIMAVFGIATEDDDGAAASGSSPANFSQPGRVVPPAPGMRPPGVG